MLAASPPSAKLRSPSTSLQPPYSLVTPDIEESILPYCGEHNIGVIVYSPMRNGLLSGTMTKERMASLPEDDIRHRLPPFQEPNLTRNLALVEKLRAIGNRHGHTPGEVAIAWTLRRPDRGAPARSGEVRADVTIDERR